MPYFPQHQESRRLSLTLQDVFNELNRSRSPSSSVSDRRPSTSPAPSTPFQSQPGSPARSRPTSRSGPIRNGNASTLVQNGGTFYDESSVPSTPRNRSISPHVRTNGVHPTVNGSIALTNGYHRGPSPRGRESYTGKTSRGESPQRLLNGVGTRINGDSANTPPLGDRGRFSADTSPNRGYTTLEQQYIRNHFSPAIAANFITTGRTLVAASPPGAEREAAQARYEVSLQSRARRA